MDDLRPIVFKNKVYENYELWKLDKVNVNKVVSYHVIYDYYYGYNIPQELHSGIFLNEVYAPILKHIQSGRTRGINLRTKHNEIISLGYDFDLRLYVINGK